MRRLAELLEDSVGVPTPTFGLDDVVARAASVHKWRRASTAIAIVVVVSAGLVGIALSLGHQTSGPAVDVSPTTVRTVTSAPNPPTTRARTDAATCDPAQLSATFGFVNNAYYALGGVVLTNNAASSCTLSDRPQVHLTTGAGKVLAVDQTAGAGNTPPSATGFVVLRAHAQEPQAGVQLDWRNWCGVPSPGSVGLTVRFAGWSTSVQAVPASNADPTTVPPCVDKNQTSTLGVANVAAHDQNGYGRDSSTNQTAPGPADTGARTAAATVPYVEQLVATRQLPHASAVRRVSADGAVIVVSTTLTDHAAAEDLYEQLSRAAGCDDSYLLVRGYRVVLQDGSQVTHPRPGFQTCAGT